MFALQFNKLKESLSIQLLLFPTIQHEKNKRHLRSHTKSLGMKCLYQTICYSAADLTYIHSINEDFTECKNQTGYAL